MHFEVIQYLPIESAEIRIHAQVDQYIDDSSTDAVRRVLKVKNRCVQHNLDK